MPSYFYLFLMLLASAIAWGIYFFATQYKRKLLKQALVLLPNALPDFYSICNPGKEFTNIELSEYTDKYLTLYSAINIYGEKKFNKHFSAEYDITTSDYASQFYKIYKDIKILQDKNNSIHYKIIYCDANINSLYNLLSAKLTSTPTINDYFTFSDCDIILNENSQLINTFNLVYPNYKKYFSNPNANSLHNVLSNLENLRVSFNHNIYIPKFIDNFSDFFDEILAYPLDKQQRNAIVTDEDNTLVISSAGSGKTSTIIGKARYLVDCHNIDPNKILIITYTRKAAEELRHRLGDIDINASTFHSLAMSIIGESTNHKPSVAPADLLNRLFYDLVRTSPNFVAAIGHYMAHLQSRMGLEHDYDDAREYFSDRKKYGIQSVYSDMDGNTIFTRSEEEKRICTYLTELGIKFRYEERYEHNTFTKDFSQYKPDFSIYYDIELRDPVTGRTSKTTKRVYLEHFAIDKDYKVPLWFGRNTPGGWEQANNRYLSDISWKRNLHREKRTKLIETTSADFRSGKDFKEILTDRLRKAGVPINPLDPKELYQRIVNRNRQMEKSVLRLFEQFIALLKSNCVNLDTLIANAKNNKDSRSVKILTSCIKPLFDKYTETLISRGEVDFTDLIIQATDICNHNFNHNYDYILVDEFQDISTDRYQFLNALRNKRPLTKLFCVGDDWQSIYRFAGSNMKLFYKFEEFFGFTEQCKIETTYRFFDPLLQISSSFIQQNPEQLRKDVKAFNTIPPTPINSDSEKGFISIPHGNGYSTVCQYPIEQIPEVKQWILNHQSSLEFVDCGLQDNILPFVEDIVKNVPKNKSIYILGRYTYDIECLGKKLTEQDANEKSLSVNIGGRKITYLTVHSAKGLEADYVILINCNEGTRGFPSLIEDDPILSFVLSEEDNYEHAEERRLFYVALTRARRKMYVLYNNNKPSPFVTELHDVLKPDEHLCPICQGGHVVLIREGVASNGSPFKIYGCSNANAGCPYFERVFDDNTPSFKR